MLRILLLLVIVGVAAYFTNPKAPAYETPARDALQAAASADLEQLDIGGVIGNSAAQLSSGEYETFYVASKYSMPTAADARVECWGAFTFVRCAATAQS